MTLAEYLRALGTKRRIPGQHDCATLPCDWTVLRGFADPMTEWRDGYSTEAEIETLTEGAGGLLQLFERGYSAAGIPERTGPPLAGDVGVICIAGEQAGSVFTGERWTFVGERGIGFAKIAPEAVLKVWAVGHG